MNTKTILGISLAAIFTVSMIFAGNLSSAEAGGKHAPAFRIDNASIEGDVPTIETKFPTGSPVPPAGDIYAYVINTNVGLFAIASHNFNDDPEQNGEDTSLHAHKVTSLDSVTLCFTLDDTGVAIGEGTTTIGIEGLDGVTSTEATGFGFHAASFIASLIDTDDDGEVDTPCIKHIMSTWAP